MLLRHHLEFWINYLSNSYPVRPVDPDPLEMARIEYYCKDALTPHLGDSPVAVNSISPLEKTGYAYDWYRIFSRNDTRLCHVAFGDVQYPATRPTFCKSRPIAGNNSNNVLLPLNTARHFEFPEDPYSFKQKRRKAVWRGAAYKEKRQQFLKATRGIDFIDAADTSKMTATGQFGKSKNFLSIHEQMESQFVFAIEGNDVASNLKWVMASNSVPVMPRPEFETWFCEGQLISGQHYIEIKRDFSDIGDVLEYYMSQPKITEEINIESTKYASRYANLDKQFQLAQHVIKRYFNKVEIQKN